MKMMLSTWVLTRQDKTRHDKTNKNTNTKQGKTRQDKPKQNNERDSTHKHTNSKTSSTKYQFECDEVSEKLKSDGNFLIGPKIGVSQSDQFSFRHWLSQPSDF
jgi:hypothetical protein